MTKRQIKAFIEQEIAWCLKMKDNGILSADYKNGYIVALREVEKKFGK